MHNENYVHQSVQTYHQQAEYKQDCLKVKTLCLA